MIPRVTHTHTHYTAYYIIYILLLIIIVIFITQYKCIIFVRIYVICAFLFCGRVINDRDFTYFHQAP